MTKREILIDDKTRVEKLMEFVQISPRYIGTAELSEMYLILKCLNDLLEGAINRAKE